MEHGERRQGQQQQDEATQWRHRRQDESRRKADASGDLGSSQAISPLRASLPHGTGSAVSASYPSPGWLARHGAWAPE